MAVTRKILVIFVCSGLLLSCIAGSYVAQREYTVALDDIVNNVQARALNRADMQLYFHQSNKAGLKQILEEFLDERAAVSAAAYSSEGKLIASRSRIGEESEEGPALRSIRGDTSVTATSLTAYDPEQQLSGTDFWSSLTAANSTIQLVTPVFSPVNPLDKDPQLSDFTAAMNAPGQNKSLVVIGYIHVELDRALLLREIRPAVVRVFCATLLLTALITLFAFLATRRTLSRLDQLNLLARQVLSGDRPTGIESIEEDEFADITRVLRNAAEGASNHRSEAVLEHKLLQMKAEERASQLSQRETELSRATLEINTAKEQLHRLANYDSLTSLPNRHLFAEQLSVLLRLCARNAKSLAVLFLNLNDFHRINESLGRSTGDLMLLEVGRRLVGCLRSSDVLSHYVHVEDTLNVSRLGGDEFAIVLSQLDNVDSAGLIAQRVMAKLVEPMVLDGHELVVTPRIGIAVAPRDGMEAESLLKSASTAMNHAKSKSGSNYLFYHEEMEASGEADLKMESELRRAIDRNELRLHYQPQVDTSDGSIVCAEALLRWEHPEYGFVSPAKFIGLAERMGLLWELGDWALVEACREMKALQDQGLKLPRIAINISPQQLKPAFVNRVVEVLRSSGLSPSMLELGLSEAILMGNDKDTLKFLQELKATGVFLSLENFGTLHAPISYLSRHPLDEMKIDRSFVADCDKRKDAARLVKAILAMARSLNLRTVAEGVETEGEFRFLVANHVTLMRGYLFSKPVPAAELRQLLVVPWHFMAQLQRMALLAELKSPSET